MGLNFGANVPVTLTWGGVCGGVAKAQIEKPFSFIVCKLLIQQVIWYENEKPSFVLVAPALWSRGAYTGPGLTSPSG